MRYLLTIALCLLALLALVATGDAANQRVLSDCDGWTANPTPASGDSCYDTTLNEWTYYDGTNWRCSSEQSGIINVLCPPYNVAPRAATTASVTGMQLALDRMKNWTTSGLRDFKCIYLGEDVVILNASIKYDTDNSSNLFCMYSHGNGGLQFTEDDAAYGLRIAGTGETNLVWFDRVTLTGGGSNTGPLNLVECDQCAQVWFTNGKISDPSYTGIEFIQGGHITIDNNLFTENVTHDTDMAYIRAKGAVSDFSVTNNRSENASNSTASLLAFSAASATTVDQLIFSFNVERGSGLRSLADFSYSNAIITGGVFIGNTAQGFSVACLDFQGQNSNSFSKILIQGNVCDGLTATPATYGIPVNDMVDSIIQGNVITQADAAFYFQGQNDRVLVKDNILKSITDYGVFIQHLHENFVIDGLWVDGATTADVRAAAGTSSGGNIIKNVWATDGSNPIITLDSTGWDHATDSLELANGVQVETCGATLTLTPVYRKVHLAVTASPCVITLAEPGTNGVDFTATVLSTSGTTADIADDGSIANLSAAWNGGVGDTLQLQYIRSTLAYWAETSRSDN